MSSFSQINTNIQAQRAFQNLSETSDELQTRQERLSTGLRINSAEDDAAGFEIANQLEARTGAQGQALRNIGDSKSLLSTAEGSLDSQLDILQSAKEKATQAANDSLSTSEREAIQGELNELTSEVQDIAENTTFNGDQLIASGGTTQTFQTGSSADDTFDVSLPDATATTLGSETESAIGEDSSVVVKNDGSTVQNTSVEGGEGLSLSSANPEIKGSENGGTNYRTLDSTELGGEVVDDVSDNDTGGRLTDGFSGGTYNLEITRDSNVGSEGGFRVEVAGSEGTQQTLELNSAGSDFSGDGTIVLETDNSSNQLAAEFKTGNAGDLTNALSDGDTAQVKAEVGGEGIEFSEDVTSDSTARENAIKNIDAAIDELTSNLSDVGATQNRLSFKESNLETAQTNLNAAQSRIEDADFAKEQTRVAKLQVQQQSGTAQLAQANAAGQSVLSLLQ